MSLPRVSVIIPHLNTPGDLQRCLSAVTAQKIDHGWFEVIVVDNGSRMTLAPVQQAFPEVKFLVEATPGPGPARNLGAQHATADILAFVDADILVCKGWLQAGLDAVGDDPFAYIGGDIGVLVANPDHLTPVEAYDAVFAHRQKKYVGKDCFSATGNLIMTRKVFDIAGPFGGILVPEDKQFGERAFEHGIRARYAPDMRVLHPAPPNYENVRTRWARLISQAYSAHNEQGGSPLKWKARALAVILSAFVHAPMVIMSHRISGIANRCKAIAFLIRIRWARGIEMVRIARKPSSAANEGAISWNRQS